MRASYHRTIAIGRRGTTALMLSFLSIVWSVGQASAQGLLDFLFERLQSTSTAPAAPPQALAYGDPGIHVNGATTERPAIRTQSAARMPYAVRPHAPASSVRAQSYCIRLCDGRFFPMQHHSGVAPTQLCNALCPASPTRIFSGSEIGHAVATDGLRYAHLSNAFAYRKRIVPDCTCNGRDIFGLASIDIDGDPTLRAGDVVVTQDNRVVFEGKSSKIGANFSPINGNALRTIDLPRRLASQGEASAN